MKTAFVAHAAFVGAFIMLSAGSAAAQGNSGAVPPCVPPPSCGSTGVSGSGTPGTVPLWTGSGDTLADSHIQDNGTTVNVSAPVWATASHNGPTVAGSAVNGVGVSGYSSGSNGVVGKTDGTSIQSGVSGFGVRYGVIGFASATDFGWGVKGVAAGQAVGVEGISATGVGVRGSTLACGANGCAPTAGVAGQFVAGAGGVLLHGFLSNFNGPGGWAEKFKVDTDGNLWTYGNAYKPGGGSWSVLSDRRLKKSIEPIGGALSRVLKLRGVTYEYANPTAFGELPGPHIGMVAQDVKQVFPSWVDTGADGYDRLTFRGFEAVTVEAMRELDANSKATAARLSELEQQNAELRRAVDALAEALRTLQHK